MSLQTIFLFFFHEMYTLTEIEMVQPKFLFLNLCYDLYSAPMILHNKL